MVTTTQEGVDGYRVKAMRTASVAHGSCAQMSKTTKLLRDAPLSNTDGWNMKGHSHLTVARNLREKTFTSLLIGTLRTERRI